MSALSSSFVKYSTTTNHPSLTIPLPTLRISCAQVSTRPKKNTTDQSEERRELVRLLTVKITSEKEPLLKTLNKHVKHLRTEHCFFLFQELGKQDRWLQCIQVFRWMQKQRWYIVYCMNGLALEADSLLERAIRVQVFPDASAYKLLSVGLTLKPT
ncbi:hypothetical protein PIB30_047428 [Stylosanthes scabra]|uniref:Uncharacterized protein n=1 Tax=Stylosanthes scabra TaxID=79078 RepID=A0ABU6UFD6_9FABA|nr:hypothetical protein [Stylosanthes scabra]